MTNRLTRGNLALGLALAAGLGLSNSVLAAGANAAKAAPAGTVVSDNVTEADVLAAQRMWGDALVRISTDYDTHGFAKAKATAEAALDAAYGYQLGAVLFKPTLTTAPHTFRVTKEGALAYFVGGNKDYPNDSGFALKGWRSWEMKNVAMQLRGDTAIAMGNLVLTDKAGKTTVVDKTWGYARDDQGVLRIVLHHSSLPVGK
jgi:hypothetical protein